MSDGKVDLQQIEFVEFATRDLATASKLWERMGFVSAGLRTEPSRRSKLYVQGDIRLILTASSNERDPVFQFTRSHGDGVCNVGYRVADARGALAAVVQAGAREASPQPDAAPTLSGKSGALLHRTSIAVFGDVRNTFVTHEGRGQLTDFFSEEALPTQQKGKYLQAIDHLTVNLERGQMDLWADFYRDMFGFYQVRYFDIRTERTGLISRAMRSPNGRVTMPFNEPTDAKSQIQEYLETFHGPGIQHIAFHTGNIVLCLEEMRSQKFSFLTVPETYYDMVRQKFTQVTENIGELAKHGILVDGNAAGGYLLQIFTENAVGPLFVEFIQRKGDNGFGDGNFRALFEAIERDQMRRGYL